MALLAGRWQQATEGEGQVVLLSGEAGIGKSRIVEMFRQGIANRAHAPTTLYQCSPFHLDSPLHPIISRIQREAGFAANDPPDVKLGKLEALLRASTTSPERVVPLFAALLSIDAGRPLSAAGPRSPAPQGAHAQRARPASRRSGGDRSHAGDFRGRPLGRSDDLRSSRPYHHAPSRAARAADHDVPARVQGALDRASSSHGAGPEPAGPAALSGHDRVRSRARRCRPTSSIRSSRRPTACRCSSRSSPRTCWSRASCTTRAIRWCSPIRMSRSPFPRRCGIRSWRGSTGWKRSRRWRRSEPRLAGSSPIRCWRRSPPCARSSFRMRCSSSSPPSSSSCAARRRPQPMCSSMRWFRTPPTTPLCEATGSNCMRGSRTFSRRSFPRRRRPSRKSSPIISCWPAGSRGRSTGGTRRAILPSGARPTARPSAISAAPSTFSNRGRSPRAGHRRARRSESS